MSSNAPAHGRGQSPGSLSLTLGVGAGIAVVLGILYLLPGASLGLWEPWETSLASLARGVATHEGMSPFAPFHDDGLISRPWLEVWLFAKAWGWGGGSEFGFRLPLALLTILGALAGFGVLQRYFGVLRAAATALLFGVTPFILLSATNLAGGALHEVPLILTMLTAAVLVADSERARLPASILLGPLLAMCFWGGGALGLGMPLATFAVLGFATHEARFEERSRIPWMILGGIILLGGLLLPLALVLTAGWTDNRDFLGLGISLALPLGLLLFTAPGSRVRLLAHPIGTPIGLLLFALLLAPGVLDLRAQVQDPGELAASLLYQDFLNGRVLPTHVTFDVLIRLIGASTFPVVILVPFGFAWLYRSAEALPQETDDPLDSQRAIKQLFAIWLGTGFVYYGFAASFAGDYSFPLAFPMAAAVALALGDQRYRQTLIQNRDLLRLAGLIALLLLAITSKDIRGVANEELGKPGPHVVFERFLSDGALDFPADYAFRHVRLFLVAWALTLLIAFWQPIRSLKSIGKLLGGTDSSDGTPPKGRLRRLGARIAGLSRRIVRPLGRLSQSLATRLETLRDRFPGRPGDAKIALVFFVTVSLGWAFQLAFNDLPRMNTLLTQRGIFDTFEATRTPDTPLYVVGGDGTDNSYYVSETETLKVERISDLRELFCGAEERIFVLMAADALPEAYFTLRDVRQNSQGNNCGLAQEFFVLDTRSSRYILVSNQLDEGAEDQNPLLEHIFTNETLPENLIVADGTAPVADGRLRLVGWELPEVVVGRAPFEITTYWEVIRRPSTNYKSFVHVDRQGGRINGDHDLVEGLYPMRYWVPGEIVRDRVELTPSRSNSAGVYTVFYGFFRGDNRLSVTNGNATDNRIRLGTFEIH